MNNERIQYLLQQYLDNRISEAELHELAEMLLEEKDVPTLQQSFENIIQQSPAAGNYNERDWDHLYQKIIVQPAPVAEIASQKVKWLQSWRAAAAAVLILGLGLAAYFFFSKSPGKQQEFANENRFKNDIRSANGQTALVLSDGRRVVLDSISGLVAKQGSVSVVNQQGEVSFKNTIDKNSHEIVFNILQTGKGNQYRLILPDGSRVWLNAVSSIRFPNIFPGNERIVELDGEGYFEVAPDKSKPFHVRHKGMDIQVLGTHFNVNTYEDEPLMKTTLLEGSVKVTNAGKLMLLKPGEQVSVDREGEGKIIQNVNTNEVVAWKENNFSFENKAIEPLMRELARWYDINIKYEAKITEGFNGNISRNEPISKVLHLLELTGQVRFTVEGKMVTVMK